MSAQWWFDRKTAARDPFRSILHGDDDMRIYVEILGVYTLRNPLFWFVLGVPQLVATLLLVVVGHRWPARITAVAKLAQVIESNGCLQRCQPEFASGSCFFGSLMSIDCSFHFFWTSFSCNFPVVRKNQCLTTWLHWRNRPGMCPGGRGQRFTLGQLGPWRAGLGTFSTSAGATVGDSEPFIFGKLINWRVKMS